MAKKRVKTYSDDKPAAFTDDEKIVIEARDRFKKCVDWESIARSRQLEDEKFYFGDTDNGYQWPTDVRKNREIEAKPCLTVNQVRQHCLLVTNDSKQNKAAIKIRPVGNKATYEGSQVMEGIVRHIEYQSNAQQVYDHANEKQVRIGVGYWRVQTDYVDETTFDQEIYIKKIENPHNVFRDPDAQEQDKSDMRFAFVYTNVPRDEFNNEYPEYKDKVGQSALSTAEDWLSDDHVRVAEYYRRVEKRDELIVYLDPQGNPQSIFMKGVPKELLDPILAMPDTKRRPVMRQEVQWFKIAGDQVIDRTIWMGSTIPIVQIVGEESVIEGQYDCRGMVRYLKDQNRMYNYWTSAATEQVALQTKIPYIGSARAIEGYEEYWQNANKMNYSILPYNSRDDEGNDVPPPQRIEPPAMSQAYVQGMQIAVEEMRAASGQRQPQMGQPGNETSGKAINARQRQSDIATYHFVDNQAVGILYTGKILIELIPKIYDTKRIIRIMGEDGVESTVVVDPQAQKEFQQQQQNNQKKVEIIFNPSFAKYSVEADVGPAYATRRQEAFNAFVQIMSAQPDLMKVAGDLMFRAADFPMAEDLAERLRRMVPESVLADGPSPELQQAMQQNQQLNEHIKMLLGTYQEERIKWMAASHDKTIDAVRAENDRVLGAYKAETDRMKVLEAGLDPSKIAAMTAQLVLQVLQTPPTSMPTPEPPPPPVVQPLEQGNVQPLS